MSRSLPSRPNLDHLRKQAKDLLATARPQFPDWHLADAQFALARDYGFTSWPALKAHVDALPDSRLPASPDETSQPPALVDVPNGAAPVEGAGESPLTGRWVANVGASARHPAMLFQSATLDIDVSGARVAVAQVVVDADGRPSGSRMTFEADGTPRQPDGVGRNHWLTAQWLDAWTLEVVDAVDGREAGRGRYAVSRDGQTLTVTAHEQRLVFDRA